MTTAPATIGPDKTDNARAEASGAVLAPYRVANANPPMIRPPVAAVRQRRTTKPRMTATIPLSDSASSHSGTIARHLSVDVVL
jgi:hypothetical protein